MTTTNKVIDFQGTLMLARELFKQSSCPLEQRIIKVLNALTGRDSPCTMMINIQAKLKKRYWWGEPGEHKGTLKMCRMEEKALRSTSDINIHPGYMKTQDIYSEIFYVKL